MAVTAADVISAINSFTWLSCQTQAESNASTNTTANLLYNGQSRTQLNFSSAWSLAQLDLVADETRLGITLPDTFKKTAYAYLIGSYYEKKFKDWNATTVKSGDDQITRSGIAMKTAYEELLGTYIGSLTAGLTDADLDIVQHTDYTNYPDEFKDSQMDVDEIDLED